MNRNKKFSVTNDDSKLTIQNDNRFKRRPSEKLIERFVSSLGIDSNDIYPHHTKVTYGTLVRNPYNNHSVSFQEDRFSTGALLRFTTKNKLAYDCTLEAIKENKKQEDFILGKKDRNHIYYFKAPL